MAASKDAIGVMPLFQAASSLGSELVLGSEASSLGSELVLGSKLVLGSEVVVDPAFVRRLVHVLGSAAFVFDSAAFVRQPVHVLGSVAFVLGSAMPGPALAPARLTAHTSIAADLH